MFIHPEVRTAMMESNVTMEINLDPAAHPATSATEVFSDSMKIPPLIPYDSNLKRNVRKRTLPTKTTTRISTRPTPLLYSTCIAARNSHSVMPYKCRWDSVVVASGVGLTNTSPASMTKERRRSEDPTTSRWEAGSPPQSHHASCSLSHSATQSLWDNVSSLSGLNGKAISPPSTLPLHTHVSGNGKQRAGASFRHSVPITMKESTLTTSDRIMRPPQRQVSVETLDLSMLATATDLLLSEALVITGKTPTMSSERGRTNLSVHAAVPPRRRRATRNSPTPPSA